MNWNGWMRTLTNKIKVMNTEPISREELKDHVENAKLIYLKQFPPEEFGEDSDCEEVYTTLEEMETFLSHPSPQGIEWREVKELSVSFWKWAECQMKYRSSLGERSTVINGNRFTDAQLYDYWLINVYKK